MEKQVAINILEDIRNVLQTEEWKREGIKNIDIYIKGLKVATDSRIQKLINEQSEYLEVYGEMDRRTLKLNKKVDKEIRKIFNS